MEPRFDEPRKPAWTSSQCFRVQNLSNARFLWPEDCQARFRWWAFGLKASSSGRGSLDRLLAHREDVRDAVSGLLRSLASALDACLAEPGPLSLADDVDDAQSDASIVSTASWYLTLY